MMAAPIKVPSATDIAVAKRLKIENPLDVTQADRDRVLSDLMARRGQVPVSCDREQIPVAPARGPVLLFHPLKTEITDAGNVRTVEDGRYKAMQIQDAFHKAEVQARSRDQDAPFTPGQIGIGRDYADLFQRCESSGLKLSQIGGASGGGAGAAGVSEAMLADLQWLRILDKRIGNGVAMVVRRVRPSLRGAAAGKVARNITDARLVRLFCVDAETLGGVLQVHGWSDRAQSKNTLHVALCAALDRMRGFEG